MRCRSMPTCCFTWRVFDLNRGVNDEEGGREHAGAAARAPDGLHPRLQLPGIYLISAHAINRCLDSRATARRPQLAARAAAAIGQTPPPAAEGFGGRRLGRCVTLG